MLTDTLMNTATFTDASNFGVCSRCREVKLLSAYRLCADCDHIVDEEYEMMYQESLEFDSN